MVLLDDVLDHTAEQLAVVQGADVREVKGEDVSRRDLIRQGQRMRELAEGGVCVEEKATVWKKQAKKKKYRQI